MESSVRNGGRQHKDRHEAHHFEYWLKNIYMYPVSTLTSHLSKYGFTGYSMSYDSLVSLFWCLNFPRFLQVGSCDSYGPTMTPRLFSCTAEFFSQAYLYTSSILKTSSHWYCFYSLQTALLSSFYLFTPSYNCLSANSCFFWKTFSFMFYFILIISVCTYVYMSAGVQEAPVLSHPGVEVI